MNLCVSDEQVIVNIQGIRYVNWGESDKIWGSSPGHHFFVQVNYKGNHQTFYYKTEAQARSLFNKIREAMDKSYTGAKHE